MELSISLSRSQPSPALCALILILNALVGASGEQESENLSGLSTDPFEDIFVLRENGTTCLMADFAAKILVPYDARASNYVDLITEQAEITIPRGARVKGKCGSVRAELHISWLDNSFIFTIFFLKETHNISQVQERFWEMNKIQLVYDTSQIYFKDAINPGKHTAMSHHLRLFQTPEGKSYKCKAQETLLLISSDHKKMVSLFLSQTHIQPFDISSDFIFSEATKCAVDQQERLEEILPLILGLTLGLLIVVMLTVYHIHQKYTTTARQTQVPRDRAQYKHM